MNDTEIQIRVNNLVVLMLSKGLSRPSSTLTIRSNATVSAGGSWKTVNGFAGTHEQFHYEHGDTATESLDKFEAYVNSLPSAAETKLKEFMSAIGKAIEIGKESGIDAEYLNPLLAQMKKLSANIITDGTK